MAGPFNERRAAGVTAAGPALGVVETSSVARGWVVADAMVKRAPVTLLLARPVSPGKHVIVVSGDVAEVDEAMAAAVEVAGAALVDKLLLALAADGLLRALGGAAATATTTVALGLFETASVASALLAADAACKAVDVGVVALRLADGIGGRAYFVVSGEQADVEAAMLAAEHVTPTALRLGCEVIARPHEELLAHLVS